MYKVNPKMSDSGVLACIPQNKRCTNNCQDCFFQSGRSYLEPLAENLPNMPDPDMVAGRIVRVNDGNDSYVDHEIVKNATKDFPMKFYNSINKNALGIFMDSPVVITVNPGNNTDTKATYIEDPIPRNLMFVRFRVNTWNTILMDSVIMYYTCAKIPVVLTFMAYHNSNSIPESDKKYYIKRVRTLNTYWAIKTSAWRDIMREYEDNIYVYSCGRIEGESGNTCCSRCGNCVREYFVTMERIKSRG